MARTSKSRGASGFQMRSGNASPYKFLGKALGAVGGGVTKLLGGGAGAQKVGSFVGGGGLVGAAARGLGVGGGAAAGAAQGVATNPVAAAAQQKALVGGGMGTVNPMIQRNEFEKRNSPLKATDRVLVEGAYDAASGKGTAKYGATAGARAWTDIVDTVEDTVNRSSKAMAAKDRRRQKVYDRSRVKYRRWYENPIRNNPLYDISNQREHGMSSPHGLNSGNPQLIN